MSASSGEEHKQNFNIFGKLADSGEKDVLHIFLKLLTY